MQVFNVLTLTLFSYKKQLTIGASGNKKLSSPIISTFSKVEKRETSKFKAKLLLIDCVRQGHFIIIIRRLLVIMKTGLI